MARAVAQSGLQRASSATRLDEIHARLAHLSEVEARYARRFDRMLSGDEQDRVEGRHHVRTLQARGQVAR